MTDLQINILSVMSILETVIFCISAVIMEEDKKCIILNLCINGAILLFVEVLFFGYCIFSALL